MPEDLTRSLRNRIHAHSSAKPDATEDHPWGETVFKVRGKIFVFLGLEKEPLELTVKASPDDGEALLARPFIRRAAYVGRYGWVAVTVADEDSLGTALDLIDTSYGLISARGRRSRRPSMP